MKRRELIAKIEAAGAVLIRNGAKHDIYHNEINEHLAWKIIRDLSKVR